MQLSATVEAKWDSLLNNWALWYVGSSASTPSTSAYERLENRDTSDPGEGGARTYESTSCEPAALIVDALATDALVCRLEDKARAALSAWYCWTGTLEQRAKDLDCHVNTLRNRRESAILELEAMHNPRTKRASDEHVPVVVRRTQYVPDDTID